jgi:hypothetical protein
MRLVWACIACLCVGCGNDDSPTALPPATIGGFGPTPVPTPDPSSSACKPTGSYGPPPAFDSAAGVPGACSSSDVARVWSSCHEDGLTPFVCRTRLGSAMSDCLDCLFSRDGAFIVTGPLADRVLPNTASCLDRRGDTACAEAVHAAASCENAVCSSPECTRKRFVDCFGAAGDSTCAPWTRAAKECIAASSASRADCNDWRVLSREQFVALGEMFCGGAPVDAGARD